MNVSEEEKHQRPFENNSSGEDVEESKRPHKIRRPPFEDEIEHQMLSIRIPDEVSVGNIFDTDLFEPEPAKMIIKRLKDEGYDIGG